MPGPLPPSPFEFHPLSVTLTVAALLAAGGLIGCLVVPARSAPSCPWLRLSLRMAHGALFLIGTGACLAMGRVTYLIILPIAQLIASAIAWRRPRTNASLAAWRWQDGLWLAALIVVCVVINHWIHDWMDAGGRVRMIHVDKAYWSLQVDHVLDSGVLSGWAATLGEHAKESPAVTDIWYHWGPMILAALVKKATGMLGIVAHIHVVIAALDVILVVAATSIIRRLTSLSTGWCLLLALMSITSVQWLKDYGIMWVAQDLPFGVGQHLRMTVASQMSYTLEGALIFTCLALALHGEKLWLSVTLFLAAVSAPQTLGCGLVVLTPFAFVSLLLGHRSVARAGGIAVLLLLVAWGLLHFGFHTGHAATSSSKQESIVHLLTSATWRGLVDTLIGMFTGLLSMIGFIHLIRTRDPRIAWLGWLGICGMAGPFGAFHLQASNPERFQFVFFTQAVLVMPLGVWGLAHLAAHSAGSKQRIAVALLVLGFAMGLADLQHVKQVQVVEPWTATDAEKVRAELHGRPLGYFGTDSRWWLPSQGQLGAMLGSRIIQLNEAVTSPTFRDTYFGGVPLQLVTQEAGETPASWSLRLAEHIGVHHVIEAKGTSPLPDAIKAGCILRIDTPTLKLYELPAAKP